MKQKTKEGIINSINDIINTGKERGALMQYTDDEHYDGRTITVNRKKLINFGSCSYLGLDTDERIKEAAIDAVKRYGVQFSTSRIYMACTLYKEWEKLISKMFNAPTVLSSSVSLGHHAVIPMVVEEGDVIILDQQVHSSIQEAANRMQMHGCKITIIRHNRLDELEKKIIELSVTHNRVWYMIDGVYSMYGDYAPIKELEALLNRYKQFYLYVDDAHGMSVAGNNGTGVVLSQINLHKKMILATSLNKAFAAGGGAFLIPDAELAQKVKQCGGSMMFSGPHQIPSIAAGIASAKIHLSDEIYERQTALKERLHYCHDLLSSKYNLPVISNPEAPINFIGLGLTRVGYNLVTRIMNEGFYTNLSAFPVVPETCTGLRFTITLHHTFEDIEHLAAKLAYHFPKALADEGRTITDVYRAFRRVANFKDPEFVADTNIFSISENVTPNYQIQYEKSIENISKELWNELLGDDGALDWDGLLFLEKTFSNNKLREDNWGFHYYIIRDQNNKALLATFFTDVLIKDDMLAPASVSQQIEKERLNNPYYLTSTCLMMGTLVTLGKHLYIDRSYCNWKGVLMLLLDTVWLEQGNLKANSLNLRDFDADDIEMRDFLMDQGFIKIDLPDTHIIENPNWENKEDYLKQFTAKKRYILKQQIFKYEHFLETRIVNNCTEEELDYYYSLYQNVYSKSFEITGFELPKKLFTNMLQHQQWEIIELKLKPDYDNRADRLPVAVCFCYKTINNYNFLYVGMDYNYANTYSVGKQALWQIISRSKNLGAKKIDLGFTASQSKRKIGAKAIPQVAYVQMQDSFNMSVINAIANTGSSKK